MNPAESAEAARRRLVVGISGATGVGYRIRVFEHAWPAGVRQHVIENWHAYGYR